MLPVEATVSMLDVDLFGRSPDPGALYALPTFKATSGERVDPLDVPRMAHPADTELDLASGPA